MKYATCHQDKKHEAKGLCKSCYNKQNHNKWKILESYKQARCEYGIYYRKTFKLKRKETTEAWNKNNKEARKIILKRSRDKRRNTPHGQISHRLEVSIREALKSNKANRSWESLVGYSVEELKIHLESKFKDGMSWEYFLNGDIHIDHIIPKSLFKYTNPEDPEFIKCWSLSNLQPLWAKDNLSKGTRLEFKNDL